MGKASENKINRTCDESLICDMCGNYPIFPVHGHYECSKCHYATKCCEGMALDG